jgi:hypothetical protein
MGKMDFFNRLTGRASNDADVFAEKYREIFCQEAISVAGLSNRDASSLPAGPAHFSVQKVTGSTVWTDGHEYKEAPFSAYVMGKGAARDGTSLHGYWVPQGGVTEIARNPGPSDPKFLLTPSFSGCTAVVENVPGQPDKLRVRHISGGRHEEEYGAQVSAGQIRGVDVVSSVRWRDYAHPNAQDKLTTKGAMFMAHEQDRGWVQYWQVRSISIGRISDHRYAATGPNDVRGHSLHVLDNQERFNGLVTLEAGIRSERGRYAGLPDIAVSESVPLRRGDAFSRTAAIRPSASTSTNRDQDRSPPRFSLNRGRGRDTGAGH